LRVALDEDVTWSNAGDPIAALGDTVSRYSRGDDFRPEDACDRLRGDASRGEVKTCDDERLAELIEQKRRDNASAFEAVRGSVRIWMQPPMTMLLERCAAALSELPIGLAPGVIDENIAGPALRARYRLVPIWHESFIPFLDKGNGDNIYVDPMGIHGAPGALVDFDHERPEERKVLFDSVSQWLEALVEGIEAGLTATSTNSASTTALFTGHWYPWKRQLRLRD
jgi:hypothetical protein